MVEIPELVAATKAIEALLAWGKRQKQDRTVGELLEAIGQLPQDGLELLGRNHAGQTRDHVRTIGGVPCGVVSAGRP